MRRKESDMRRTARIATLGALALALACGGAGEEPGERPEAEAAPADGGMLVTAIGADPDVLFPPTSTSAQSSDIYDQIFWYLMRSDPDLVHHQPGLADSFRFSEDSLAVDFFINPGVTWHDGHPFTAEDVVFSHDVCTAPEINFSAVSWLQHITEVEAVDSLTVRFHYDRKYMPEYMVTDANVCYPIPEHILGEMSYEEMKNSDYTRRPVGTGPFRFVSWEPGQRVVIEAYPDFFKDRAHLNRVTYRVIPEPTTIVTEVMNGNVDLWPRFQSSFYPELTESPGIEVLSEPGRSYTYITYNTEDPIFSDVRVRKALTYGLDRQQIVDALLYGQAKIATQPIISIIWAHDPEIEPYPYDPERARQLLEEAGWTDADGDGIREKDGRDLRFELKTNSENQLRKDVVQIAQQQWKEIGARATPNTAEANTFFEDLMAQEYQAAVAGWVVGIKPDLEPTFKTGELFNFPAAKNARLDSIMAEAVLEADMEEATELWSQAQRIVVDEAYYTFLFEQNDLHAIHERFRGVDMTPYGWGHYLEEWYVPEGRQRYDVPVGASPFAEEGEDVAAEAGGVSGTTAGATTDR